MAHLLQSMYLQYMLRPYSYLYGQFSTLGSLWGSLLRGCRTILGTLERDPNLENYSFLNPLNPRAEDPDLGFRFRVLGFRVLGFGF